LQTSFLVTYDADIVLATCLMDHNNSDAFFALSCRSHATAGLQLAAMVGQPAGLPHCA
jgi:hypothetical protein